VRLKVKGDLKLIELKINEEYTKFIQDCITRDLNVMHFPISVFKCFSVHET